LLSADGWGTLLLSADGLGGTSLLSADGLGGTSFLYLLFLLFLLFLLSADGLLAKLYCFI
jgi:hypothetical protein